LALPKDFPIKLNRRKQKNAYIKSDNSKFETTIFNNQNTLLFSRNTYIYSHDKIDNNLIISKNQFSNRGINDEISNLNGRNILYTPINNLNKTLFENTYKQYFQTGVFINFQIENFEIFYESKKANKSRMKYKIFEFKTRFYNFPTNKKVFSCQQISITNPPVLDYLANLIKTKIKTILIILLYLYIWLNLLVFIQSIYKQFGKNIIKICVMPLIYMLVIKLTISFNVMMFLTTFILFKWGDYFMKISKLPIIPMIIFKGLVPPLAFHHYTAIRNFIELFQNNKFHKFKKDENLNKISLGNELNKEFVEN